MLKATASCLLVAIPLVAAMAAFPAMIEDAYPHGVTCGVAGCQAGGSPAQSAPLGENLPPVVADVYFAVAGVAPLLLVALMSGIAAFAVFVLWKNRTKRKMYC